ncbi:NADH pyrophosphatase [Pigmentiphaga humi]|uniref:NAD(+) diphosphatase n=1 Tax=Pigmentiphaga humi TaxID=2478468 RepID=A0A3P4AX66_9BURK|nr:NAD(+) diphosphatase [Pigmentiphaga humi]VCU68352.1 NADH pyrophosphatase [Pigmentiphaga humi]
MQTFDRSASVGFGFNPLDRLSERRADTDFVQQRRRDPATRFFVLAGEVPVLRVDSAGHDPLFSAPEMAALGEPRHEIFLGNDPDGRALFAVSLDAGRADAIASLPGLELIDVRTIATRELFEPGVMGEIGASKSVLGWHQRHCFCANCGAASRPSCAGWRRDCEACGTQHFPRVDPVVIMLAVDGERCLLGRQARFASGMYTALAGFLEPGETIEDAVRREIHEEAGIRCAEVAYFASQPWPFPASLMLGCFARAIDTGIVLDNDELEDARWFTRAEVRQMLADEHPQGLSAPRPFTIAYQLLKAYAEETAPAV